MELQPAIEIVKVHKDELAKQNVSDADGYLAFLSALASRKDED